MTALATLLLLTAASGHAELQRARELVRTLKYAEALKPLSVAKSAPDLDREQLCEVYELEGVVLASLKRPAEAVESFKALLALNPDHRFATARAPRVMTPYYEARDWLKREGPLSLTLRAEQRTLTVDLRDPLKLVAAVKVKLDEDGKARELSVSKFPAAVELRAERVEATATALGRSGQTLANASARLEPAPPPAVAEPTPAVPQRGVEQEPPPAAVAAASEPPARSGFATARIASVALLGGGAVCAALGVYFGVSSQQGRALFNQAVTTAQQTGTSPLTMSQAMGLNAQVTSQAWAANILFGVAGALAIAAVLLFLAG